jgi:hypothetical protein
MVGGAEAHEDFLIVTHAPPSTYAGVKCERTTRSSIIYSFIQGPVLTQGSGWDGTRWRTGA